MRRCFSEVIEMKLSKKQIAEIKKFVNEQFDEVLDGLKDQIINYSHDAVYEGSPSDVLNELSKNDELWDLAQCLVTDIISKRVNRLK